MAVRVASEGEELWPRLMERAWPHVERLVARNRSLGPLRASADDRAEVVSRVFARLRRDEFRALRLYGAWQGRHADKDFGDWLAIVTANVIRDHVSHRMVGGGSMVQLVDTLTETASGGLRAAVRPSYTNDAAAHELAALAERTLPAGMLGPLRSWLQGHDFGEIATRHELDGASTAQATVRAALARLRHQVRA
jgi:hypothetical protein